MQNQKSNPTKLDRSQTRAHALGQLENANVCPRDMYSRNSPHEVGEEGRREGE